jgi:succinate dehydrogenase / fumarate reductase iron-sulfur subunit
MLRISQLSTLTSPIAHPVCFDNDCRESMCGMCGLYINGRPHGNDDGTNMIPIPKHDADMAMDAASCIGCGACVAACKNASAMLFVGAKVSHLALLPQGRVEAGDRVRNMVRKMDELGFGNCTNTYACEAECPKLIKRQNISRLNRHWIGALFGQDRK